MSQPRSLDAVAYHHTQRAPLCLLLYGVALTLIAVGFAVPDVPALNYLYPPLGLVLLVMAASFHSLTVQDLGNSISIGFGPIPLFQRRINYQDIDRVAVGRTTLLEGWGIHMSLRGGWVWNLWGRDCVVVQYKKGVLRIGTDDANNLANFLTAKASEQRR